MKLSGSVTTSTIGTKIDGVPVSDFGTNGIWQFADNTTNDNIIHKIATITLPRAGKYLIFTSGIHFISTGVVRHSAMIRHGQSFGGLADNTNNSATDNAQLRVLVENAYYQQGDSHKDFNICLTCYYEWDGVTTDGEQLHLELDSSNNSDANDTYIYWGLHPNTTNQVTDPNLWGNISLRDVTSVFQAIQIGPSSNQIPLHPSLPEINTSEAGKSLTVNSAGTALEYGEGGSLIQTSHRLERGEYSKTLNKTNYNPDTNDYQIDSNFKVGFTPTNSNSILRFSCDFNIGTSQANMWLLFHLYRRINGGTWVRINVNNTSSSTRLSTFLAAPRIEVAFSGPGTLGSITNQQLRNMQGEYFDDNWSSSWSSGQSVEYTIYWQYLYGQLGNATMYLNRTHSNEDWGSTSSTLTLQELNHSNTTLSS
jgi:hypothetical protein